ncbi:ATPase AAA [Tepiditoga spiralis]|uniref:ATPase AAA n=1 Tax=Tepiditoga spiralis TaxID=2108365 RepID=A0A7G1G513_9BACT|nr:MoxR family ATPase [Tepiditoga spiralis]BBE30114.1 ATPase AAA [Tepiditoga spiralis]
MIPSEIKYLSKKIMESNEIPLLWGHFGVGKTDIAKEIAKETGRDLIILVISQMEPGDLIGMPSKSTNKTIFLKPDWWPENPNTIIMIDEINRAHRSIRNAIMQLLVDRRIHNHVLPKDTWIMAAANPPDEEYDQVDLITDPAFMSRFFHLTLNANVNDWTKWAKEEKVKDEVIDFINNYPEYMTPDHIVSMKLDLRPSPRSWFKFSNVLKNLSENDIKKYGYSLGASILGADATNAFFNHLNNKKTLPTAQELLIEGKFFERLNDLNTEEKVSLILRINNYIEKLEENEMIQIIDNSEHKIIAKNIKSISKYIPKDSIFSVLRNLDNLIEKSTGVKKAFYDKLLEELSISLSEEKWLEEL